MFQATLKAAEAANMVQIGTPYATEIFRKGFAQQIKITTTLKSDELSYLQRHCPFETLYTPIHVVTNDHALLAATREVARTCYEDSFHIMNAKDKTLAVGASSREISKYISNPSINYLIWGEENKDYDRIIRPALTNILKRLKKHAAKNNYDIFLEPKDKVDPTKYRAKIKRYTNLKQVLNDWSSLEQTPPNMFFRDTLEGHEFNTLVFEDSIYNYTPDSLTRLFVKTNARIAYGYALLPMELIFPDYPPTNVYRYHEAGGISYLTFNSGQSNGYAHPTKAWKTLLASPVIKANGVQLCVEITTRIGPMCVFKIIRAEYSEEIVRTFQVPESEMYVMVLDLWRSVNHRTCKISSPLKYFSVRESEFFDIFNYIMSLDPKSRSVQNVVLAIRRRINGMALISRELVHPWDLPKSLIFPFAVTVLLYAEIMSDKMVEVLSRLDPKGLVAKINRHLRTALSILCWPVTDLLEWLLSENLTDRLVKYPDHMGVIDQKARVTANTKVFDIPLFSAEPNEEDVPDCPTCFFLQDKLGDQKLRCRHKGDSTHLFKMTTDELATFRAELLNTDNDPPGLKAVKERCLTFVPKVGFEIAARVEYLFGGPGTGKSYMLRALAEDGSALVLAPFTKLGSDYIDVKDSEGKDMDLVFKTTHRALDLTGRRNIFVDEFTAFDYRYLACSVYRNTAENVWLAGDLKQTGIKDEEGLAIRKRIDVEELSTHELVYNFRNPPKVVAMLNELYGYKMIPMKKNEDEEIHVVSIEAKVEGEKVINMAFSKDTAGKYCANTRQTVRSFQGSTHATTRLVVTGHDAKLAGIPELAIVALSRHTDSMYIAIDESVEARKWVDGLSLRLIGDQWKSKIPEPEPDKVLIMRDDEVYKRVVIPPVEIKIEYKQMVMKPILHLISASPPNPPSWLQNIIGLGLQALNLGCLFAERMHPASLAEPIFRRLFKRVEPPPRKRSFQYALRLSEKFGDLGLFRRQAPGVTKPLVSVTLTERQLEVSNAGRLPDDYLRNGTIGEKLDRSNISPDFKEHLGGFEVLPVGNVSKIPVDKSAPLDAPIFEKVEHAGRDAYLLLDSFLPPVALTDEVASLNFSASQVVEDSFTTATIDPEETLNPVNVRGHPKKPVQEFYTHGPGFGKWFDSHKVMQTLEVVANRYQPRSTKPLDATSKEFVRSVVDLWFTEYKTNNCGHAYWSDEENLENFAQKFVSDALQRKYDKRFKDFENPDVRTIRFHLKRIFKPDTTLKDLDLSKAGQGISAWDSDIVSFVGLACRVIEELDRSTDNKTGYNRAFTDNGIPEDEFGEMISSHVREILGKLPFMHGLGDQKRFDASQDAVTQYAERYYLLRLGVSEDFIDFYFSFREKYHLLFAGHGSASVKWVKTSGEPWTLANNGKLAKIFMNYILRGKGPSVIIYKGDDVDKMQMELKIDQDAYENMVWFTNLDSLVSITKYGEFCGMTLNEEGIFPNIMRKLNKLCSMRFTDYKHFCQYQTSIRDTCAVIERMGLQNTIRATAGNLKNVSYAEVDTLYQCYSSFGHIGESQFYEIFKKVSEGDAVPVPDANKPLGLRMELMH